MKPKPFQGSFSPFAATLCYNILPTSGPMNPKPFQGGIWPQKATLYATIELLLKVL